jgi:hypothetical protein
MKDNLQVALLAILFAFVGFRLYQKYFKKGDGKKDGSKKPGSSFTSSSGGDDYEPYSKE